MKLHIIVILLLVNLLQGFSQEAGHVIVGALRWDAWYRVPEGSSYKGPVSEVERSLSPAKYHFRAPFFTEETSDTSVHILGYDNDIMGKEIEYASSAGLDYWAFLLYDEKISMSCGLNIYLQHKDRNKINFCAIAEPKRIIAGDGKETSRILRLLAESNYQKVCGNRPLIYIFRPDSDLIVQCGSEKKLREKFNNFRKTISDAGYGDPYLVIMCTGVEKTRSMLDLLSADAVSEYAFQSDRDWDKRSYNDLCNEASEFREEGKNSGFRLVPLVMSGWNRWPRIERPVSWEKNWQKAPGLEITKNYDLPSPEELAGCLKDAINWVQANPLNCPARALLIYAWNEHDEGGWLCPTFRKNGTPDDSRLKALQVVLDERQ
jgi:hypothetical protein